jgi:hypothetical protein
VEKLKRAGRWAKAADTTLSLGDMALRLIGVSTVLSAIAGATTWIFASPINAFMVGLVVWIAVAVALLVIMSHRKQAPVSTTSQSGSPATQPIPTDTDFPQAEEVIIDLGDTTRLFLMDGARFVPGDNSERRTIFLPALIDKWAGPVSSAVESGRTFVAHGAEFDNCDIYGPAVFVLKEGSVEDTFHKCEWEEEWKAFWPATKRGRYVGVIGLKNCTFRRCKFTGVAFVVKPDEYRRLYRRFTGDDFNGPW